jgi:hypothetical protein
MQRIQVVARFSRRLASVGVKGMQRCGAVAGGLNLRLDGKLSFRTESSHAVKFTEVESAAAR